MERRYHFLRDQEPAQLERDVFRKGKADPIEDEQEEGSKVRKMLCEWGNISHGVILYAVDKV
jgi:hypothetical protein